MTDKRTCSTYLPKCTFRQVKIGNNVFKSDTDIANEMNIFFCTVGDQVANKISNTNVNFRAYLRNKISYTFFLQPLSFTEVYKQLNKVKTNKSSGPDNISNTLIKYNAEPLTKHLTIIYNASIISAKYPTKWKLAKVIALFKKGSTDLPENYRPISLLDSFGKKIKKLIYKQMMSFIKTHSILFIYQYGFREDYSTTLALIDIVDKIKQNLDNNEYAIGIFIDIKKAFDTVNHDLLYTKLEHYGFRGHALNFIKSYLTNRTQYTRMNGYTSTTQEITCGVPQGSVLGPLLFLLYINDIQHCIDKEEIKLFADDTGVFIHHPQLEVLLEQSKSRIKKLYDWFSANKLSLSFNKSNFIVFHGKNKR